MVCFNPNYIYIRNKYPIDGNKTEQNLKRLNKPSFNKYKPNWIQIPVPCGHCDGCRLDRANDWATRITNEAEIWDNKGVFVTLTYNDKHLPFNKNGIPTLYPKDIKDFKKRLRKYCSKHDLPYKEWENPATGKIERPIRTFECGEYGPTKGRPHYHMLIMNWKPKDLKYYKTTKDGNILYTSKTLSKIWGKGFAPIGEITYKSASYVCRYTMKKAGLSNRHREYYDVFEYDTEKEMPIPKTKYRYVEDQIKSEFITMSTCPGIGKAYFIENFEKIKKNNGIMIKVDNSVKIKRIPRYYKKIWEKLDWEDYERYKYAQLKIIEENNKKAIDSYNLPKEWHYERKLKFVNDKRIQIFKDKMEAMRKRGRTEE